MNRAFDIAAFQQCLKRCRFAILNDFEANGYGVPTLTSDDVIPLNDVPSLPKVEPKRSSLARAMLLTVGFQKSVDISYIFKCRHQKSSLGLAQG